MSHYLKSFITTIIVFHLILLAISWCYLNSKYGDDADVMHYLFNEALFRQALYLPLAECVLMVVIGMPYYFFYRNLQSFVWLFNILMGFLIQAPIYGFLAAINGYDDPFSLSLVSLLGLLFGVIFAFFYGRFNPERHYR